MKLISWNVAGFRDCLKKGISDFFYKENADIFCLQEVKTTKDQYDFSPKDYYEYLFSVKRLD
jgi:exodeoxyribonuclease-3